LPRRRLTTLTVSLAINTGLEGQTLKESVANSPFSGSLFSSIRDPMNKPTIVAYLKPSCGWSNGVRAILRKYDLPYEDRDIINDPMQRQEMIEKSGQMLSPCVEVNGRMLADISGEEVEAFLLANHLVTSNDRTPDSPIDQPCAHELPQSTGINFVRK
jgi:monothiol glutaredoxin